MRFFRPVIIAFLFIFLCSSVTSQDKKLFKKYFQAAEEFFFMEEYEEAIYYCNELLKTDAANNNLHFLTGASYLSLYGQKTKAISHLEEAVKSISAGCREGSYKERDAPGEALFALARAYHINNELDKAIEYYEKYRNVMIKRYFADVEYVNKQIASCELAKHLMKQPVEVKYVDMGEKVNYAPENYNPVISGDGRTMVYMVNKPFYRAIMMTQRINEEGTKPRSKE